MAQSHKEKVVLEDGEAYVVAPLEFWEHLIKTYKALAEEYEGKDYWLEAADFISRWINTTLYSAPIEDDWR